MKKAQSLDGADSIDVRTDQTLRLINETTYKHHAVFVKIRCLVEALWRYAVREV